MTDDTTQAAKRLAEMFERPGVNLTLYGIDVSATIHSLVARAEKAESERDRLRNLLSLAEAKLSDGRLYVGYGNVGPLHDYTTASIIQRARAALKENRA